ncbi:MAG: protein kinase domain-containing protein [Acidimicrobiales bacterium]
MQHEIDLGIEHLADVSEIGRGGFSVVYAATNTLLGMQVAVKVLGRLSNESDRRRFERECQVMGRLSHHPNVVTVHHAGYARDGSPYLVMELVEGGSLADRLGRTGPVPWPEAVDLVVPIADALAYVHEADVLHRDVKPENILLGADGRPLLTDFGIARLSETATNTSTGIAASWLHAPPETFDDKREPRSDLYSLASTLHQLIAGQPPFWRGGEESINPLMYRLINEPAPRLDPSMAPPALADVVAWALAKNPASRPADVGTFARSLEQVRAEQVAAATVAIVPPLPAPPPDAAFDPNPRTAAAAAPAWFAPSAQTRLSDRPTPLLPQRPDPSPVSGARRPALAIAIATLTVLLGAAGIGVALASQLGNDDPEEPTTAPVTEPTLTQATLTQATLDETDDDDTQSPAAGDGRLGAIIDRGVLNCGVNGVLPFFSIEEADGSFTGFDADFCRVVAAAVLGDATAVNFVPLTAAERFVALQTGQIDVLFRNTSQTASRSGEQGVEFPITTFFDGQTIMTPLASGLTTFDDLDGATVCVTAGTTTEIRLNDLLAERGLDAGIIAFESNDELAPAYVAGQCDAWSSDRSLLATQRRILDQPDDHLIMSELISTEPLGPAVASGDSDWAQAVSWAVAATIQAWEVGLDSTNVGSYDGIDPTSLIVTGQTGFDPGLGLQPAYPRLILDQVGNYEEIYNANFADSGLPLDGSANDLARNGGLMIAPPLR